MSVVPHPSRVRPSLSIALPAFVKVLEARRRLRMRLPALVLPALLLPTLLLSSSVAYGWGATGHRVTGALAEQWLSPAARARVDAILGAETLAQASTWPDEMRSAPQPFWQETANPWHYVTVPPGQVYADVEAPREGDAYTALQRFETMLRDPDASLEEQQLALRFAVHIIGDLHQPLHVGNGRDRGGNQVRVRFFGEDSNLHSVWDSGIINRQALSYTEWTTWLSAAIDAGQMSAWSSADPMVWMGESAAIRERIYPEQTDLSWEYGFEQLPVIRTRLSQAGVRMAMWLNAVFAPAE